jgi:hypothetical protein
MRRSRKYHVSASFGEWTATNPAPSRARREQAVFPAELVKKFQHFCTWHGQHLIGVIAGLS